MNTVIIFIVGFILTAVSGKLFLNYLIKKEIVQPILNDAPDLHKQKSGTPTMGGISFLIPIFLGIIVIAFYSLFLAITLLIITIGYGYIGFKDDRLKVFHKKNESGLSPIQKLILQFGISIIAVILLITSDSSTIVGYKDMFSFDMGLLYFIIAPIMIVGFSNATNLTDGLDGLLSTLAIIAFATLAIIAGYTEHFIMFNFLIYVVACLLAFLVLYNRNPAKMFMGDTGSLMLGALYAVSIIILKVELLGIILGLVFIFEVISVTLQVSYFKYTKKKTGEGKRLLKMAPLHHHFEKSGYSERKVVLIFSLIQLVLAVIVLI